MTISGSTYWNIATSAVVILLTGATAQAVPVVPNFTQETNDEPHRDNTNNNRDD